MRVLLGQAWNPTHTHRTTCEDCGGDVYLGDRQQALEALHEADVIVRCQVCQSMLGDLRVPR
jgi:hypothetical protein